MSTLATSPPSFTTLDTEAFRRKLAGLTDPLDRQSGLGEKTEIRDLAHRLCSILASLYDVPGDRTELWNHIDKAIETSLAKVSDDDVDRFLQLCLESVQAAPSKVAACKAFAMVLETVASRDSAWKFAFLDYLRAHRLPTLVHGRARWEMVKKEQVEL